MSKLKVILLGATAVAVLASRTTRSGSVAQKSWTAVGAPERASETPLQEPETPAQAAPTPEPPASPGGMLGLNACLLLLLAIGAAAGVAVEIGSGRLAIRPGDAGAAAAAAILAATAARALARRWRSRRPAVAAPVTVVTESPSLARTKKVLLLMMLAGVLAYVGGRATFAIFSAETANPGNGVASGTLTMGDQVGSGTVCASTDAATLDNNNSACDVALTLANMAPGVSSGEARLTISNSGSLDASKFYLSAPYPTTTLNGALTLNVGVTSLVVGGFNAPVTSGDQIMVSYGGNSQTFTASAGVSAGATSIPVSSVAANHSYPVGARVTDTSANATPSNTDCYDVKTTSSPVAGATYGTQLNFNPIAGNPLCSAMLFWVQEQTSGNNYCWYGRGSSTSPAPESSGICRTPTTATLSSTLGTGGAITALPVNTLTGNVKSGDSIVVTEGTNTQTFTASSTTYIGATSIPVNSATPNFVYDGSATVTDSTALGALNGDTTDTISNFDTGHPQTGRIQLYPLTGNNAANTSASVELDKYGDPGSSRVFYVGVYMPAPAGTAQNQLQGLASTFGLNWHIDQ